ncbi:DUF2029 domain-containing protein [Chloroflexia bacterium SDU3-3]|nr:DUF2029 domain-containing protein [Chloroflexia bacterium SDU3-3]
MATGHSQRQSCPNRLRAALPCAAALVVSSAPGQHGGRCCCIKAMITTLLRQPRRLNLLCCLLAALWLALLASVLTYDVDDFKQLRRGAVDLIEQGNPYANRELLVETSKPGQSDDGNEQGFKYTPVFAYLFRPFGMVSHALGQRIWFGVNLLALAGLIAACLQLAPAQLARRYWGVLALLVALAPPTRLSLQLGQTSIVMALLLVAAYLFWNTRSALSGIFLALATIVKLYPGLMGVYALVRGPRRVAWWAVAAGLLLLAIFLPFYGIDHYRIFASTVITSSNHPYGAEFNLSFHGFWTRLLVANPYSRPLFDAPLLARALTIVCSGGLLALCADAVRRVDDERKRLPEYCLWLCAMLLLSPINGSYNSVLLLLPGLVLLRYVEQTRDRSIRAWLVLGSALAVWPAGWTDGMPLLYNGLHIGLGVLLLTPGIYGIVIYCGVLYAVIRRPWPAAPAA